jgi:hypothetical protein
MGEQDGRLALVAFRGADLNARRVIAEPFRPLSNATSYFLRSCGRHRDHLVLSVDAYRDLDASGPAFASFVIVVDQAGTVLRTIAMPDDAHFGLEAMKSHPERRPLGGELTRFVPYLADGDKPNHFVMLDLEAGNIAWRGPDDENLIYSKLFRTGDRWHLIGIADQIADTSIAVFDGNTGHFEGAIATHNDFGVEQVSPTQVIDGRIWLHGGGPCPIDEPPIAVLDAATLVPISNRAIEITDTSPNMRRYLQSGSP